MENLKKSKLLNGVLFIFSFLVCTLITFPIAQELDGTLSFIILLIIVTIGIIVLTRTLEQKLDEHVFSEIKRHKYKHIQEFFDTMEDDLVFNKNVLREDIPIYDDERKKVGTQTVYSAISQKKQRFLRL
jgi:hypothetical protein